MTIERRLSQHFDAAATGLPEPVPNFDTVVRRGRRRQAVITGATALAVVAVASVLTLGVLQRNSTNVEFDPAVPPAPLSEAPPTEAPTASPTESATTRPRATAPVPTVALEDLGAAVLLYEPGRDGQLEKVAGGRRDVLWPDPVVEAFPDGEGGVVLQPRRGHSVVWLPADGSGPVTLVAEEDSMHLRGLLADGRVVYSTRVQPGDAETASNIFYAVNRVLDDPEIERLYEEGAHESWFLGPVPLGPDRMLSGGCHLLCTLWEGFGDDNNAGEPVYDNQRSIDGLTATPDGSVVAFWESPITEDRFDPQLVLLDGESFRVLARIDLPVDGPMRIGIPVVSLADGGNRVLVAAGNAVEEGTPLPRVTHLIRGALSDNPRIENVAANGVVRWLEAE